MHTAANTRRTIAMKHLRERVNDRRTSELEMAEEATLRAAEKIFDCMSGQSSDFKGAPMAQKNNERGDPVVQPTEHSGYGFCSDVSWPSCQRRRQHNTGLNILIPFGNSQM
jgi:hypothetical protein